MKKTLFLKINVIIAIVAVAFIGNIIFYTTHELYRPPLEQKEGLTVEIYDPNPICPKCKVGTKREYISYEETVVCNPLVYDEQGKIISGNTNIEITTWKCLKCETVYKYYRDCNSMFGKGYYDLNTSFKIDPNDL